jgi:hypothetical protein
MVTVGRPFVPVEVVFRDQDQAKKPSAQKLGPSGMMLMRIFVSKLIPSLREVTYVRKASLIIGIDYKGV